ncbi:sperm-egg fusion protein TMEM95 isoform X2 [Talpa occidentalis]|uniref:sperm-egg fusion protein TMEM95 isoform X2 n=1 Tax=Talpa occidentalis TaxID=50954 RepID=UPI0023F72978|nr:sperm-egg fusion protein TMEM95 isoform X2 [Talpa occidentalis]
MGRQSPSTTAPMGLMWILALGGVFLEVAQACIFCHSSDRNLSGRLARLCSLVKAQWKDCEASWNFSAFALDELSMIKVIEKTHRVLKVMEIKRSLSSFPAYWQWLQNIKLPEYTREALCAPACRSHDLWEARSLLLSIFTVAVLLGFLTLMLEFPILCLPSGPGSSEHKLTCKDADSPQPPALRSLYPRLLLLFGGWRMRPHQ